MELFFFLPVSVLKIKYNHYLSFHLQSSLPWASQVAPCNFLTPINQVILYSVWEMPWTHFLTQQDLLGGDFSCLLAPQDNGYLYFFLLTYSLTFQSNDCISQFVCQKYHLMTSSYAFILTWSESASIFSVTYCTRGFYNERMEASGTECFTLLFWKTLWCVGIIDFPLFVFLEIAKIQVVYYALIDNLVAKFCQQVFKRPTKRQNKIKCSNRAQDRVSLLVVKCCDTQMTEEWSSSHPMNIVGTGNTGLLRFSWAFLFSYWSKVSWRFSGRLNIHGKKNSRKIEAYQHPSQAWGSSGMNRWSPEECWMKHSSGVKPVLQSLAKEDIKIQNSKAQRFLKKSCDCCIEVILQ